MIPFKINDQEVEAQEGWTVLETAKRYGIPIPTLCYHEALAPHGACRLCIVEAEGPGLRRQVISSCTLQVSEGLLVETHSPLVEKCRRVIFELLLGRSPEARPLIQMAEKYGVTSSRFKTEPSENCVRCGLCVRVCRDTYRSFGPVFCRPGAEETGNRRVRPTLRNLYRLRHLHQPLSYRSHPAGRPGRFTADISQGKHDQPSAFGPLPAVRGPFPDRQIYRSCPDQSRY